MERIDNFFLFLSFVENTLTFSLFRLMLAVKLPEITFIMLRYIPCKPSLSHIFIMKGCWILPMAIYLSIEVLMWFLSFSLLIWWVTFIDLLMLNQSFSLKWGLLKDGCSFWCIHILYLIKKICIYVHKENWYPIFFILEVFIWFIFQVS